MTAEPGALLDDLDGERPEAPFTVAVAGRIVVFAPAAGPPWRDLMEALAWPPAFLDMFGPDDPADAEALEGLTVAQMRVLLRTWRVHHGLSVVDADHLRLASMLSKPAYRDAAERDLWETYRLDLGGEWQSRRWRRLLCLLDGLRRTSHVHEAMTLDEDLARNVLAMERKQPASEKKSAAHRRMSEFSVEAELLSYAVDRLGELINVSAAARGGRPRKVTPMPRPESALVRMRDQRSRIRHKFTVARVFGFVDEKGNPTGKGPVEPGLVWQD